tara:strand:- start:86 stop:607 length:522 start_codon:yes stop_codon:yes gene_type:complete
MLQAAKERVLLQLQTHNVPLQHCVQLICRIQGISLKNLSEGCGYHRNHLYQTLSGIRSPSKVFRDGVSKRLSVDPWAYCASSEAVFDGSSNSIKRILIFLQRENIPLQHSVSMICKTKGIRLGKLAISFGIHRNYLFQTLSGDRTPSADLRNRMRKELGVDPWNYAPRREVCA